MNRNIRILAVLTSLILITSLWAQPKITAERPGRPQVRGALLGQEMNRPGPGKASPPSLMDDIDARISGLKAEKKALIGELQAIQTLMKEGRTKEALERIETFIKEKQAFYEQQLTTLRRRADTLKRSSRMQERRVQMANIAGTPMKSFHGKDFEGKKIDVSDYKDKVIVLEWMNPQCPFSNHFYKNKAMVNLARKYQDKGVVWLAINSTHFVNPEEMKQFIEKHKVPYSILDDHEGKIGHLYNARTTPHMFVINKEGVIVYNGAIDSAGDKDKTKPVVNYVDQALTELLDNKPISIPYKEPYGCTVKYAP